MAPPAKKTKTAPVAPGAAKAGFSKLFSAPKAEAAPAPAAPAAAAPEETKTPAQVAAAPEAPAQETKTPAQVAAAPAPAPAAPKTPARAEAPAAPTPAPAPSPPALSGDQKQRIEDNRRLAMERKRAREEEGAASATPPSSAQTPSATPPSQSTAPSQASAPPSQPQSQPAAKAGPKAGAKARGKAKAKAAAPAASPAKVGPKTAETTPEKTPPPVAEKAQALAKTACDAKPDIRTPQAGEWKQYVGLYHARLRQLRRPVTEEARSIWGGRVSPQGFRSEICTYRQGSAGEVVVVGILFKTLTARENIIRLYRENQLKTHIRDGDPRTPGSLCSDDDALYIEDASMRLRLRAPQEAIERLCTGLVAAVHGTPTADGCLRVDRLEDVVLARLPPPPPLRSAPAGYLALVSGLAAPRDAANAEAHEAALERLVSFVAKEEVRRLVVCGGALCVDGDGPAPPREAIAKADAMYARMAAGTEVHVMPGREDPTNLSLPQMPMHPCLFRKAQEAGGGGFRSVSNPYRGAVEGSSLSVLGHSGQPVEDLLRVTRGRRPLDALRLCLEGMHLAPTAPDTLPMPPFEGEDALVIREVPHVLFSGGHERAEHNWSPAPRGDEPTSGTQLVAVPEFHRQPVVILVNLQDPRDVKVQDLGAAACA